MFKVGNLVQMKKRRHSSNVSDEAFGGVVGLGAGVLFRLLCTGI